MAFFRKINEQYMNELHCSKKNKNKVLRKERKKTKQFQIVLTNLMNQSDR